MKLAIFGCGKIANRIAKACLQVEEIDLVGFASKDTERAKQYAKTYGCREYGDYDHFLNSDIDAVYIAVYNPGHRSLIERAILHHKNVICEKPMLFSIEENREVFALARKENVLLMEALKSVFLPSILEVKRMLKEKELGEISSIYTSFMRASSHTPEHWINDLKCGGAFKDIGSYCIGTMNYLLDEEPVLLSCKCDRTETRSERNAEAILKYGNIDARACVSNDTNGDNHLLIQGDRGWLKVENFWKNGSIDYEIDGVRGNRTIELVSDFYYELKHFADLSDRGIRMSPVMDEKASENILKITDR